MEVMEAIRKRRSIRAYSDRPVEREKLLACLEAARWAPSAGNRQPREFLVIEDREKKAKLAEISSYAKFAVQSPVLVAFITNPGKSRWHLIDGSLATMNFMLAAQAQGLGTCWAGVWDSPFEGQVKELLGIPADLRVLCLMSLGYPAESPSKDRVELEKITHWETYGNLRE